MATYIKTLKEDNGDITYPQTKAGAVYTNEGSDVQTVLDDCTRYEEIASTSTLSPTTTSSMVGWSRSVVSCTLTSQTNTSWSRTVQINKIEWGNGVVEFCCNSLDTTYAANSTTNINIVVTWPTAFSSVYRFVGNIFVIGNASARPLHISASGTKADMWLYRDATSSNQNTGISFSIVGVLSS